MKKQCLTMHYIKRKNMCIKNKKAISKNNMVEI